MHPALLLAVAVHLGPALRPAAPAPHAIHYPAVRPVQAPHAMRFTFGAQNGRGTVGVAFPVGR